MGVLRGGGFSARGIPRFQIVLFALAIGLAGFLIWRATGDPVATILFQCLPFITYHSWAALPKLSPDILTMVFGMVLLALVLPRLRKIPKENSLTEKRSEALAGFTAGLVLASKITGLPLLLVPLWAYRESRPSLIRFVSGTAISFLIVIGIVHRGHFLDFFRFFAGWVWRLASHRGKYGSGEPGLPVPADFLASIWKLATMIPGIAILLAATLCFVVIARRRRRWLPKSEWTAVTVLIAAALVQFLMAAKNPSPRYLLPGLPCLSLGAALALLAFTRGSLWDILARSRVRIASAVIVVAALIAYQPLSLRYDGTMRARFAYLEEIDAVIRASGCKVVPFYRASVPAYALAFGNNFVHPSFSGTLRALYPDFVQYEPGNGFVDIDRRPVPVQSVFRGPGGAPRPVCLRGNIAVFGEPQPFKFARVKILADSIEDDGLLIAELTDPTARLP